MDNIICNVGDAVLWAASFLGEKGVESPRLNAELLMGKAMCANRAAVLGSLGDVLAQNTRQKFIQLVYRRGERFPLQYIIGRQDFMSLPFLVQEGVLIPRSDTEVLMETVLDLNLPFKNILDVGTGSGIIASTLAKYIPNSRITAIDISSEALNLAEKNARAIGVQERIVFKKADVFEWTPEKQFDLIISNPPYIPSAELAHLQQEVQFEPPEALDGGGDGLRFYFRLAGLAADLLETAGMLAVEIGWQQGEKVKSIMEAAGLKEVVVIQDYAGRDRVVLCRKG